MLDYKKYLLIALTIGCGFGFGSTTYATTVSFPQNNSSMPQDSVPTKELVDSIGDFHSDLDELVITAKKEIIKSDGANLTYDMAEDDSSKGLSLLDALRKVPMVTVDGQDNIYINGESNYKIYVNGKEDQMLSSNASKVFKSMPANSVLKIEVITEPGAKYDAEGSAGILNLITETKQRKDGYSGSVSASLNNQEWYGALFGRMKYDKFSADANVVYSHTSFANQENNSTYTTIDYNDEVNYKEVLEQKQRVNFGFLKAGLNTSWEPNQSNLFTFGGEITDLDAKIPELGGKTSMFEKNGNLLWFYNRTVTGNLKILSASANASYQHSFTPEGHRIVLAYMYNFGRNPLSCLAYTDDNKDITFPYPYQYASQSTYSREHTVQLDYANPFNGTTHKLETGVKMILRHNSAYGNTEYGITPSEMIADIDNITSITQNQDIYAVYSSYTGNFDKWSTTAGLRYEHTLMGIKDKLDRSRSFTRHLNDLVPNASISYSFSPYSNLRFSYLMRISRPNIEQMNPNQIDVLGTVVKEGNPDLKSEHSNRFALTYSNYGRVLGGNVSLEYKYTTNAIESYNYYTKSENNENILHWTTANIGHISNIGLGGFLNINISTKMTLSLNGKVSYISMKSKSPDYSNSGWTGNYGANWNYTMPADVKLSAFGGQSVHMIQLQGHSNGWYYYGFGISRDFLKDKSLNIAVNASNFFTKYAHYRNYTYTRENYSESSFKNKQWRVGASITWNFGHLNSGTKKTDLQIQNDDRSTNESGGNKGIGI